MNDKLLMFRKLVHEFIQKESTLHHALWCQLHRHNAEAWTAAGRIGILLTNEHASYDHMTENPIACKWIDTRVERIHAGANEIMKEVTGSSR
jgi:hypothetical protein